MVYRCILIILSLFITSGCVYDPEHVRYPSLFQPGHIHQQHAYTAVFDPFSSQEMGPKIVGDRPSGSLDPTPALQRSTKKN